MIQLCSSYVAQLDQLEQMVSKILFEREFRCQNGQIFGQKIPIPEPKIPLLDVKLYFCHVSTFSDRKFYWNENFDFKMALSANFRPKKPFSNRKFHFYISKWPCLHNFGRKIPISEPKIPFLDVKLYFCHVSTFSDRFRLFSIQLIFQKSVMNFNFDQKYTILRVNNVCTEITPFQLPKHEF